MKRHRIRRCISLSTQVRKADYTNVRTSIFKSVAGKRVAEFCNTLVYMSRTVIIHGDIYRCKRSGRDIFDSIVTFLLRGKWAINFRERFRGCGSCINVQVNAVLRSSNV